MSAQNSGAAAHKKLNAEAHGTQLDKLSLLDASFLYAETASVPMNIAGLQHLDVPEKQREAFFRSLQNHLEDRVHLVRFMTRRLKYTPFGFDHPIWVRDADFDIDEHVKRIRLPAPGTPQQLEQLVARLHEKRLDRSRPLWEFWLIEGLENGLCAWYTKYHHACMDGVAGQAVVDFLCSDTPAIPPVPKHACGSDGCDVEDPGLMALLWDAARSTASQPLRSLAALPDIASAAWALGERALGAERGLGAYGQRAPRTRLNVAVSPHRTFAMGTLSLSGMRALGKPLGCTVNDVFLAVCAASLARYLGLRGELPRDPLIAGAPVSVRKPGDQSIRNQVRMLLTSLETQRSDPIERLLAIRDSAAIGKAVVADMASAGLEDLNVPGLPLAMGGLMRAADRLRIGDFVPMPFNVVISNVPGPRRQKWLNGAALRSHFPVSIPAHGVALNITVQSYLDRMDFSLTACKEAVPDVEMLRDFMSDAFEELWQAAGMPRASGVRAVKLSAAVVMQEAELPEPELAWEDVQQPHDRSAAG